MRLYYSGWVLTGVGLLAVLVCWALSLPLSVGLVGVGVLLCGSVVKLVAMFFVGMEDRIKIRQVESSLRIR